MANYRPTCINYGCNTPVKFTTRHTSTCSTCSAAGYGQIRPTGSIVKYRKGVTPFRTGRCSNQDGHLGFTCAINYKKNSWTIGMTQIDHIDGNHLNNVLKNVDELCPLCHQRKSMTNGDLKQQNVYNYKSLYKSRLAA